MYKRQSLRHAHIAIVIPCAGFGYYLVGYCQIKHGAFLGYTFAVDYIEFGGFERRRNLILYHFYAGAVANDLAAVLNLIYAAHVKTYGSIELERAAAGGGFGITKHYANLFAQLVYEYQYGIGL